MALDPNYKSESCKFGDTNLIPSAKGSLGSGHMDQVHMMKPNSKLEVMESMRRRFESWREETGRQEVSGKNLALVP